VVGNPERPAGTMEVQLIPRDQRSRAFTAGMVDNTLYLVDTQEGTATAVFFLVEDLAPGGVVQAEGDHKIHVINVHGNRLELDRAFDVDFNRDIDTGPARPHGVVVLPDRDR